MFAQGGPRALSFEQSGGSPRAERGAAGRVEGGGAGSAQAVGHRTIQLGFVLKRPKKRLFKADPVRREAFVAGYAALTAAAQGNGTKIFFADEAHFQADADPVSGYGAGSAGQVGVEGRASLGGLHQAATGGEGTSPRT